MIEMMYSNACCVVTLRRLRELSHLEAVSSEAKILAEYDIAPHIAIIVTITFRPLAEGLGWMIGTIRIRVWHSLG